MRSEQTEFVGGPMDGRVLPVLVGVTGHPPKVYRVPVPGEDGAAPTVYVYQRVLNPDPKGRRGAGRWRYEYAPQGLPEKRMWPWSRRGSGGS
ncbi:hypothetical protein [Wenjunlia tyrosinilytica]|uniref:Uncharacterized protein n=1 Tax=Wenjunlia tyrosinilytica TaxID=1544741 RepID=A0A917ZKG2_9ACTN|nr:hypothetical protein [Wenjunlia tyrosinilytica]GGO85446.1 hypothetical protein GCM10012280_19240 [Wenjunlia tyrosinilytica]